MKYLLLILAMTFTGVSQAAHDAEKHTLKEVNTKGHYCRLIKTKRGGRTLYVIKPKAKGTGVKTRTTRLFSDIWYIDALDMKNSCERQVTGVLLRRGARMVVDRTTGAVRFVVEGTGRVLGAVGGAVVDSARRVGNFLERNRTTQPEWAKNAFEGQN